MRVLVGGSEIRSSCTCCDGWMFRVVGIAAVNEPLLMSTFFHVKIYMQAGCICDLQHFDHSKAKQLPHFRVLFK